MKSAVLLVAIASVASATTAPAYKPLSNPGTGSCIVAGEYDAKRDEFKLGLGSCSDGVEFAFKGNGKFLQSSDGYCMSSHGNSGAKGTPVVLAACKSGKPGKQWTALSSTEQWKNGYKLCLDYDSKAKTLVQAKCQSAPLPMGSMQQYTFCGGSTPVPPAPRPPTPPPPAPVTCSQWSASWICPNGYSLVPNSKYVTCDGSSKNCVSNCCVYNTPPATQKCGTWSVKNGGPINSCGAGYTYTAGDYDICAADGSNCRRVCCRPAPQTQLCGTWSVKNGGPVNSCGAGYTYTAGDRDTCAANGVNCKAVCCSRVPPQPQTQKCGTWSVKNGGPINSCGNGFRYTAGDNDSCALDSSNCVSQCCTAVTPQLCMSWSLQNGGPNNSCGDGFTFSARPSDTCNSDGSNCANVCCGPLQN